MKKKIVSSVIICAIAMLSIVNFQAVNEYVHGNVSLESLSVMSKAYAAELPEVTITCDRGPDGVCWMEGDPDYSIGIFGLPMCETTCKFSGSMTNICFHGLPC